MSEECFVTGCGGEEKLDFMMTMLMMTLTIMMMILIVTFHDNVDDLQ